jgi:hypothetical protein
MGRACTWCTQGILLQRLYVAWTDKVSTLKLSGSIVYCFNNADTKFRHLTRFRASCIHLVPPFQLSSSSYSCEFLSNFCRHARFVCPRSESHKRLVGSVGLITTVIRESIFITQFSFFGIPYIKIFPCVVLHHHILFGVLNVLQNNLIFVVLFIPYYLFICGSKGAVLYQ